MHSIFQAKVPVDVHFSAPMKREQLSKDQLSNVLGEALACLLRKNPVTEEMVQLLDHNVPRRSAPEVAEYERVVREFCSKRPRKEKAVRRVAKPMAVLN